VRGAPETVSKFAGIEDGRVGLVPDPSAAGNHR